MVIGVGIMPSKVVRNYNSIRIRLIVMTFFEEPRVDPLAEEELEDEALEVIPIEGGNFAFWLVDGIPFQESELVDFNYLNPISKGDGNYIAAALWYTRLDYCRFAGMEPPPTSHQQSYAVQYGELQAALVQRFDISEAVHVLVSVGPWYTGMGEWPLTDLTDEEKAALLDSANHVYPEFEAVAEDVDSLRGNITTSRFPAQGMMGESDPRLYGELTGQDFLINEDVRNMFGWDVRE